MKKSLLVLTCVLAALLTFGCESSKKEEAAPAPTSVIGRDGVTVRPDWVTKGKKGAEGIYAIGSAKMSSTSNSLKAAQLQARNELASTVNTTIDSVTRSYVQDTGNADDSLNYLEQAIQQTTSKAIQGSELVDSWEASDGTMYVLMFLPYESVWTATESVAKKYSADSKTTYTEEKAQAAFQKYFESVSKN